jgi:beta-mannosidase
MSWRTVGTRPWLQSPGAMTDDLLAGVVWECTATPPDELDGLDGLEAPGRTWWQATVPGTAASALANARRGDVIDRDYDGEDWWFRCRFTGPVGDSGPWRLVFEGVATLADVYFNGDHVAHHENMFRPFSTTVSLAEGTNILVVRCRSLVRTLAVRRPRPRWKTPLVNHQNLRWIRTSLLGRVPGLAESPEPVGIWQPVRLAKISLPHLENWALSSRCMGDSGIVEARLEFGPTAPASVSLEIASRRSALAVQRQGDRYVAVGSIRLDHVERWWPCSHGDQPLYGVSAEIDGKAVVLGQVGFRTVELDRSEGGFTLLVNGEPIFCRGAVWMPSDPIGLVEAEESMDRALELLRGANANMLRISGITTYASRRLLERCDELGILVWHDAMFAFVDPPDDAEWVADATTEVAEACQRLSGHPSVAVICGNQEVEEVAAMHGLPEELRRTPFFDEVLPSLVKESLPGVPYVSSNPTGGSLPFRMDEGVCQYFGVGGYMRPLEDIRRAGVRFAAECLVLATPPDRRTVDEACGGATRAGHDPQWKRAVHHDAGRSWDMDDVRDFYVQQLFAIDPLLGRYVDPERLLDLGRATNAELATQVFTEWRRPGSSCAGGLVMAFRDLAPGAGWGLVDAFGRPKSTWFALRRTWAPLALLITDEGLNGLRFHVVNDGRDGRSVRLVVDLYADGEHPVSHGEQTLHVPARGGLSVDAETLLGAFHDVSYAFRFGPPAHDLVAARLVSEDGASLAEAVHLVGGQARSLEPDVGLSSTVQEGPLPHEWKVTIRTRRFAQWVSLELDQGRPDDSWFHLAPTSSCTVTVRDSEQRPRGVVRALNSLRTAPILEA